MVGDIVAKSYQHSWHAIVKHNVGKPSSQRTTDSGLFDAVAIAT